MPLKLKLQFIGLCTFVQRGTITHVLLPPTGGHAHGGHGGHGGAGTPSVPAHEARLFLGWPDRERKIFPTPWSIPLARTILRIRDKGRAPGLPPLPADLFDISQLAGASVDPAALGPAPSAALVQARIELDVHGTVKAHGRAQYELPGATGTQTQTVVRRTFTIWTETVDDGDLEVELEYLDTGGTPHVVKLGLPAEDPDDPNNDGLVALAIYHVPVDELPPKSAKKVKSGTQVDHFDVYYDMLKAPPRRPMPVFKKVLDPAPVLGGETGVCPNSLAR